MICLLPALFVTPFGALNSTRAYSLEKMIAYSFGANTPMIVVTRPFDGHPATNGNGAMIALAGC